MPRQFEKFEEPPIDKRPELPDRDRINEARGQFKSLLLANPNYFGTLGDIGPSPSSSSTATRSTRRSAASGTSRTSGGLRQSSTSARNPDTAGDVCSPGTPEYVRFYLSFDGGATWVDQGMGSFTAYDIPGSKPLEYDVTVHIEPSGTWCFFEDLPLARAILAWNDPPPANTPSHIPVWGEVQEAQIQIAPRRFFLVGDLLDELKVELSPDLAKVVSPSVSVDDDQAEGAHRSRAACPLQGHGRSGPQVPAQGADGADDEPGAGRGPQEPALERDRRPRHRPRVDHRRSSSRPTATPRSRSWTASASTPSSRPSSAR